MVYQAWEHGWQVTKGPHDFPHIGQPGVMREVVFEGGTTQASFEEAKAAGGRNYNLWRLQDGTEVIAKGHMRPNSSTDKNGYEYYRVPAGAWSRIP